MNIYRRLLKKHGSLDNSEEFSAAQEWASAATTSEVRKRVALLQNRRRNIQIVASTSRNFASHIGVSISIFTLPFALFTAISSILNQQSGAIRNHDFHIGPYPFEQSEFFTTILVLYMLLSLFMILFLCLLWYKAWISELKASKIEAYIESLRIHIERPAPWS